MSLLSSAGREGFPPVNCKTWQNFPKCTTYEDYFWENRVLKKHLSFAALCFNAVITGLYGCNIYLQGRIFGLLQTQAI
jgi:hypothetical protein